MKNKTLAFIPKLLCALLLAPLCAMAISSTSEVAREGQAVPTDPDWPKGVVELVNDPLRTDGWNPWFSEWPNDVYHYGMRVRNAEDINHLITKLAAIKVTNAQVCLRPEKEVGSLGFTTQIEKGNGLAATFSFGNQKRINQWFEHLPEIEPGVKKFGVHRLTKPPEALPPTLTLYVGHAAVDLEKLRIPEKIKVISEISDSDRKEQLDNPTIKTIDMFVAQRHPKKLTEQVSEIVWSEFEGGQKLGIGVGEFPVIYPGVSGRARRGELPVKSQEIPVFIYLTVPGDAPPSISLTNCRVTADTTKLPKGNPPHVTFAIPADQSWKATPTPHTFKAQVRTMKVNRAGQWGVSAELPTSSGIQKTKVLYFNVAE